MRPPSPPAARPSRLLLYARLVRLDRPIGILLLLWPTLWALWLAADGVPPPRLLLLFVAGVVLTRSAGCAVNDYFDRDIDAGVRRTAQRPLAAGLLRPVEALAVAGVLFLAAFAVVLQLRPQALPPAGAALLLAVTYPLAKRFLPLPQLHLGLAFSCSVLLAYAAVLGRLPAEAWLLFLANLCWTVAYDTFYAMCDRDDDRRLGVHSSALRFGTRELGLVAALQVLFLALMCIPGYRLQLPWPYYLGLAAAAATFLHQHRLAANREPGPCFRAFLNNNCSGALIFVGILSALA